MSRPGPGAQHTWALHTHPYTILTPPPPRSLIVGSLDVQTGPELCEHRRRQAFGEDVGVL